MNRSDERREPARQGDARRRAQQGDGRQRAAQGDARRRAPQAEARRPARQPDARRPPRQPEPPLGDHITADQVDRSVHRELRTLSKDNAEGVARHLVAVTEALAAEDLDLALAHAQTAVRRAGRVSIVRETLGLVHYRRAEWVKALSEFRTARRLSGSEHLLPLIADTERGLGRPERAIELAAGPEATRLDAADRMELAIVVSGARRDMVQTRAAVHGLRELVASSSPSAPWSSRLFYAYADALLADGQEEEAAQWMRRAADCDPQGLTDAAERLGEGGEDLVDLDEGADVGDLERTIQEGSTGRGR